MVLAASWVQNEVRVGSQTCFGVFRRKVSVGWAVWVFCEFGWSVCCMVVICE